MYNSAYYISPETIWADLTRYISIVEIDKYDVVELCAQVETRYIKDVDLMTPVLEVPLTVINSQALLPCNIFRLIDVYDGYEAVIDFTLSDSGNYINELKYADSGEAYTEDTVYINFSGTPIDSDTGYPLIPKGHENACETFCKIRLFEEQVLLGKVDKQIWMGWERQFGGQIANAKSDPYRQKVANHLKQLNTIRGEMLPRIGRLELSHKKFRNNGTRVSPRLR